MLAQVRQPERVEVLYWSLWLPPSDRLGGRQGKTSVVCESAYLTYRLCIFSDISVRISVKTATTLISQSFMNVHAWSVCSSSSPQSAMAHSVHINFRTRGLPISCECCATIFMTQNISHVVKSSSLVHVMYIDVCYQITATQVGQYVAFENGKCFQFTGKWSLIAMRW